MSKMKTVNGATKRFKVKKSGKIKRRASFRNHILTKKSQKRKRQLKSPKYVDKTNIKQVKGLLAI